MSYATVLCYRKNEERAAGVFLLLKISHKEAAQYNSEQQSHVMCKSCKPDWDGWGCKVCGWTAPSLSTKPVWYYVLLRKRDGVKVDFVKGRAVVATPTPAGGQGSVQEDAKDCARRQGKEKLRIIENRDFEFMVDSSLKDQLQRQKYSYTKASDRTTVDKVCMYYFARLKTEALGRMRVDKRQYSYYELKWLLQYDGAVEQRFSDLLREAREVSRAADWAECRPPR